MIPPRGIRVTAAKRPESDALAQTTWDDFRERKEVRSSTGPMGKPIQRQNRENHEAHLPAMVSKSGKAGTLGLKK